MSSSKRTCNTIFKIGVGLGLGIGNLLTATLAWAAPASVFEPILEDLAATAPAERLVRLPAAVPSDVELHPTAFEHYGMVIVRLDTTVECNDASCMGVSIVVAEEPDGWPAMYDEELTPIVLGNDIQGYAVEGEVSSGMMWVQDGSLYAFSYQTALFSSEDALAMANSMVSQPPITNAPQ